MIRRIRSTTLLATVAVAASLAGCGGGGTNNNNGDGGNNGNPDMSVIKDMAFTAPDLIVLAQTGDPCTKSADCAGGALPTQKGNCVKSSSIGGKTVMWDHGYCQSPCRPSRSPDPTTGLNNTDCPADTSPFNPNGTVTVCSPTSQTAGICMQGCMSIADCDYDNGSGTVRTNYVCANASGTQYPICYPIGASQCDPKGDPLPQGVNCPQGQRCVNYSLDASYGGCADICDPVAQDCPPPTQGSNGCIVDFDANDATGDCISVNGAPDAAACFYLNDCAAGLQCYSRVCHTYCKLGGAACPQGQTCQDIKSTMPKITFHADKVGLCQ